MAPFQFPLEAVASYLRHYADVTELRARFSLLWMSSQMRVSKDPAPDLMMSGQSSNCNGGGLNGRWNYQGETANGKRYVQTITIHTSYGNGTSFVNYFKGNPNIHILHWSIYIYIYLFLVDVLYIYTTYITCNESNKLARAKSRQLCLPSTFS